LFLPFDFLLDRLRIDRPRSLAAPSSTSMRSIAECSAATRNCRARSASSAMV
jgi:hypothetical protein